MGHKPSWSKLESSELASQVLLELLLKDLDILSLSLSSLQESLSNSTASLSSLEFLEQKPEFTYGQSKHF